MTIVIRFHSSNYRTFKHYYLMLTVKHRGNFPRLVSYPRFVGLMATVLAPLCAYLKCGFGCCTGIAFVDATA